MFCVAMLAVTVCCWHHVDRSQPQVDVCFHLVSLQTFLNWHKHSEVMCCFAPKRTWHAFSLKNHVLCGCFCSHSVFLVSLWQKSAPRWCFFTWSKLPHFLVQMNNLVWHVVLPSQTSDMLFHWKVLFFVVTLTETEWFWHHLDRSQHKVDVFLNLSLFVCH